MTPALLMWAGGCRRSGTHFLHDCLQQAGFFGDWVPRHGIPPSSAGVGVFIYKPPMPWLASLYGWLGIDGNERTDHEHLESWAFKHTAWLDRGFIPVRFEDLLAEPDAVMKVIAEAVGVEDDLAPVELRKENLSGPGGFDAAWDRSGELERPNNVRNLVKREWFRRVARNLEGNRLKV